MVLRGPPPPSSHCPRNNFVPRLGEAPPPPYWQHGPHPTLHHNSPPPSHNEAALTPLISKRRPPSNLFTNLTPTRRVSRLQGDSISPNYLSGIEVSLDPDRGSLLNLKLPYIHQYTCLIILFMVLIFFSFLYFYFAEENIIAVFFSAVRVFILFFFRN